MSLLEVKFTTISADGLQVQYLYDGDLVRVGSMCTSTRTREEDNVARSATSSGPKTGSV